MKKKKYLAPLSVLAFCVASFGSPAKADIVYITVTGTVASGNDNVGLFGATGTNLSGDAYTAQYTFDTSIGDTSSSSTQNSTQGGFDVLFRSDGIIYFYPTPSLVASITINGETFSFVGDDLGEIYAGDDGVTSQLDANASTSLITLYTNMFGNPGTISASITSSFTVYTTDNSSADGGFSFMTVPPPCGIAFGVACPTSPLVTNLILAPEVYTEVDPTTVPEPASMTLLGVGLLGTGIVRRRLMSEVMNALTWCQSPTLFGRVQ